MSRWKKHLVQGFTLLEVLVAVAIFALVSLASYSLFDGVLKSEQTSKTQMERLNEIQRAWMVIERDIIQLAPRKIRFEGEEPSSQYLHNGFDSYSNDSNALAFVRNGWTNPGLILPRSDVQAVAYRLVEDTLQRLHYNFVDSVVGQEPIIRPLITHVDSMTFEFFYQKKWQKQLKDDVLPQAIWVNIDTKDLGNISRKFLIANGQPQSSERGDDSER
ncbi:type II secretion system minor pseudopilin GspJ [Thalassotalea ganghwensis]